MLDPVMYHLHQARETATWVAQLMRIDPELMLPAALPLLAARLMDAGGIEDESDFDEPEAQPGLERPSPMRSRGPAPRCSSARGAPTNSVKPQRVFPAHRFRGASATWQIGPAFRSSFGGRSTS